MTIRAYKADDLEELLRLFRLNVPRYFAVAEEDELRDYLQRYSDTYFILEEEDEIAGGGGIRITQQGSVGSITWIFFDPQQQGRGRGRALVNYCLSQLQQAGTVKKIQVRTSQFAYGFFEKFGMVLQTTEKDYWAPGLDLYVMEMEM